MGRTDTEAETLIFWPPDGKKLTHWKRPWFWERLKVGREGDNRGWDGWMASLTQWTWVWVNSGSWWWAGRPLMLHSMGSQRVRHDWATELNWSELNLLNVGVPLIFPNWVTEGKATRPEHKTQLYFIDTNRHWSDIYFVGNHVCLSKTLHLFLIEDLQCVSHCCTAKWFSYTYIYIPSFLRYCFPLWFIVGYWI